MRQAIGSQKVIGQASDVGIIYRVVLGALLDDGHKPRLIREPARKVNTDVRHLARARNCAGIAGTLRFTGTLRISGTDLILGTRQDHRSAIIRLCSRPDSSSEEHTSEL